MGISEGEILIKRFPGLSLGKKEDLKESG